MAPTNCLEADETKVMLALSYIANLGYNLEESDCQAAGDMSGMLVQHLDEIDVLKGNWQLVWGPYVYKFPLVARLRDNAFYVVRGTQDPSRYVLAIAGTNPCSISDWVFEDFIVGPMVHWAYGSAPSGAKISASAALSLSIVQNAVPCPGLAGAGQHLNEFLRDAVAASGGGVNLTVTGHSLGGEMASTVPLWLADTQGPQTTRSAEWDPEAKTTISACTFAGPTAGNARWAAYFDSRLGDRTCRVWNSMDVIPHAWNTDDIAEVPDLYQSGGIDMPALLKVVIEGVKLKLELGRNDYTQIIAGQGPLEGTVDPSQGADFFSQMLYQHIGAYPELLGVSGLAGKVDCSPQTSDAGGALP